jgi:16S rRNA (guanine966-N2)-methyltransferase
MRVVAGSVGGRRLRVPPGHATRPTSELVRGAIFNSLTSLGLVDGATVCDLFAGSGALGIEALSRGAASAVFVERDRKAADTIRANLADLGLAERGRVVVADALTWAAGAAPADIAFIDPPYAFEGWSQLLANLSADVVVAESGQPVPEVEGWSVLKVRRHGGTVVTLLQRRGAPRA